jgi:RNA polymerase sigma-70 factor (ECF subfamily)
MPDAEPTPDWDAVIREQSPRLRAAVARRLDPRVARRVSASDLVQETFLEAAKRDIPPDLPVRVWLLSLARDKILQAHRVHLAYKRDARREQPALPTAASSVFVRAVIGSAGSPSKQAVEAEEAERLRRALTDLDDDDRDVILWRHFEQLTNREVAYLLGVSEPAAGKRYLRALERLRVILTNEPRPQGSG